jgi:uncharacterized membrane protein YheB (UPF0754 family)
MVWDGELAKFLIGKQIATVVNNKLLAVEDVQTNKNSTAEKTTVFVTSATRIHS